MKKNKTLILLTALLGVFACLSAGYYGVAKYGKDIQKALGITTNKDKAKDKKQDEADVVKPTNKSKEAKAAALDADKAYASSIGLYFDYANLSLEDTMKAYMAERGIDPSQVSFSYKNMKTNETFSMNDTTPRTAASTYKLPLGMMIIDQVKEGKINLDEEVHYTEIPEVSGAPDYPLYLAGFGETMNWTEILDNALIHSENTPAYIMADRLGGFHEAYKKIEKYGKSKADIKTIDYDAGNKTTTNYYLQVLDYLYKHQDQYEDIIARLEASFPGEYYKAYVNDVRVAHKPGFSQEALNVNALVFDEVPYVVSLYTAGLGGSNEYTMETNLYGLSQLHDMAYVIHEWHRVNMDPTEVPKENTATTHKEASEDTAETDDYLAE